MADFNAWPHGVRNANWTNFTWPPEPRGQRGLKPHPTLKSSSYGPAG